MKTSPHCSRLGYGRSSDDFEAMIFGAAMEVRSRIVANVQYAVCRFAQGMLGGFGDMPSPHKAQARVSSIIPSFARPHVARVGELDESVEISQA